MTLHQARENQHPSGYTDSHPPAARTPEQLVCADVAGPKPKERPLVIVVPGAGDCAASWSAVTGMLAEDADIVVADREHHAPVTSLQGYLDHLDKVVPPASVRRVILVGQSLGGLLAQLYANQNPARVTGTVLLDPTPPAIARDAAVGVGFTISAAVASLLQISSRLGLVRALLGLRAFPLYPEQRAFEGWTTEEQYRAWQRAVVLLYKSARPVAEIRSVRSVAAAAESALVNGWNSKGGPPVALLSSRAYGTKWVAMQQALGTELNACPFRLTQDRSHNIHMKHPQLTADTIRRLLGDAPGKSESV